MRKRTIILSHIAFWILAIIVETLPILTWDNPKDVRDTLIEKIFMTFFSGIVFYTCYFFIAQILLRKNIFLFLLIFLPFIYLFTLLAMNIYPPILLKIIGPMENINYSLWFFSLMSYLFVSGLWGTMFRFAFHWFAEKKREKELEKENIYSELAMLRSQINPHFLFNTLNNINSFIFREPDKTSFGIKKLSNIMSYMLYDANADKVKLTDEINYVINFMELQKLRIKEPGYIKFDIKGDPENVMIPPMLLIPFIENAFKHGKKNVEGAGIIIDLIIDNKRLEFNVSNYLLPAEQLYEKNGGFGLKNIKRRLELIYGPDYSLSCNKLKDMFIVKLIIEKI